MSHDAESSSQLKNSRRQPVVEQSQKASGSLHGPVQRQHRVEQPFRAVHPPDQHPHLHQHNEPLQAVNSSDRIQHQSHFSDQLAASDQHQLQSGHNNKHPLSAPHIPVQGTSEAQLRQTQGRSGPQYHQSSTCRENIFTPPIIQPRQHSEQHNDNQHTDQHDQHTWGRTGQHDQHTDEHDQHTNQCLDQHTNQSRPFSWAERILNWRAIRPLSTVQSLPSKPVGNPQGDNPEKKELSDTRPCSVDVETSIAGLNDLENPPPEPYTDNSLVTDVDKEMAAEVREEVKSRDLATSLDEKPYDSNNLVCPNCGKKHHIGGPQKFRDIQNFHIHVNQCDVKNK